MKKDFVQYQAERQDRRLADICGITFEDFCKLDYVIENDIDDDNYFLGLFLIFDINSPQEILNKIDRLQENNQVYLEPHELSDVSDFDFEEQYLAIINNEYYANFKREIQNLKRLNNLKIKDFDLNNIQKRLLYIAAIGALETFLSETVINLIKDNPTYFRNFIQTFPAFKSQNFSLSSIFTQFDKLEKIVNKAVLEVIYHNLDIVKNMYQDTFEISFPEISELAKAVSKRHHLVHRNGKDKKGEMVVVNKEDVNILLTQILNFGEQIADSLKIEPRKE